jgi:hypothetical protein
LWHFAIFGVVELEPFLLKMERQSDIFLFAVCARKSWYNS